MTNTRRPVWPAARRAAVFMLYQQDLIGSPMDEIQANALRAGEAIDDPYAETILAGVSLDAVAIDAVITEAAQGWTADRLGAVERAILRVAVWELTRSSEVSAAIAINEAVELAKRYCGSDAPAFVNGVLGRIAADRPSAEPGTTSTMAE
jgi:transcription antitermination protein NusB